MSLGEQEFMSSFDEKEDEMKDEMLGSSDDEEESPWIESILELGWEFETLDSSLLSLEMYFKIHFLEGGMTGRVSIPLLIWQMEEGSLLNFLNAESSMEE